jgi:hypothetical protein
MAKMLMPEKELKLTIMGNEENVPASDYYLLAGSNKPVLLHATMLSLAEKYGVHVEDVKLESDHWLSTNNFYFQCRAYGRRKDGVQVSEVGCANPLNCNGDIGRAQAGLMADKRAKDRLLIHLLGLVGKIYSEDEFDQVELASSDASTSASASAPADSAPAETKGAAEQKTESKGRSTSRRKSKEETSAKPAADASAAVETVVENESSDADGANASEEDPLQVAGSMIVSYGKYRGKNITLAEMKEKSPDDFNWLLEANMTVPKMVELQNAAKLLAGIA